MGVDLFANGQRVKLDQESLAVVAALRDDLWLRFEALCARLPRLSQHAVQLTVLRLAQHDLVSIRDEAGLSAPARPE